MSTRMEVRGEGGGEGHRPVSIASEVSNHTLVSENQEQPRRTSRLSKKSASFGKRSNSMKRNPKANVLKRGWLFKQASSGVKSWNKRWFVLADRCLFYYRDEKEEAVLASIPLFSFRISPVQPADNIARKLAFKAEHTGIRTYYLSAENKGEMEGWINAMNEAASIQTVPLTRTGVSFQHQPRAESNHTSSNHKRLIKPDMEKKGGEADGFERYHRQSEGKDSGKDAAARVNGLAAPPGPFDGSSPGAERRTHPGYERPQQQQQQQQQQPNGHGWQQASPGNAVHRRGFVPRTNTEKLAQRLSSLTQLQQWVNIRRSALPTDDPRSSQVYHTPTREVPEYYNLLSPYYQEEYPQFVPAGGRPDSICSVPSYNRLTARWSIDERQPPYPLRDWQGQQPLYSGQGSPVWHGVPSPYPQEVDSVGSTMRRLSLQPRSRSVPRSPSQAPLAVNHVYSPARSPSGPFQPARTQPDENLADPGYTLRRSRSAKYEYAGERRPAATHPYHFSISRSVQDRMVPYQDRYQDGLHHYKVDELEIDKLLGRFCEQTKNQREQEKWVLQLRKEKESLESALETTHREMAMYRNQPGYTEQLVQKKESLQNQLVNIRGELSQATTAELGYKNIQKELWRIQDVMEGLRKTYPERVTADTLKQNVPNAQVGTSSPNSPASPLSSNSITSPLSPFSPDSELQMAAQQPVNEEMRPPRPPLPQSYLQQGPLPAVPPLPTDSSLWAHSVDDSWDQADRGMTTAADTRRSDRASAKPGFDVSRKENRSVLQSEGSSGQSKPDTEVEKQNKVGVVPPRTKSPPEESSPSPSSQAVRTGDKTNGELLAREWARVNLPSGEAKSKMSVEEQAERMKRHQNGSLRGHHKRRSLTLTSGQLLNMDGSSPKPIGRRVTVPRRKTTEIDISQLEAAVRGDFTGNYHETPRDEIARLRRMDMEPEHYSLDITKELTTPDKVFIPERYIEFEPEIPLSPEEMKEKQKKVERIKTLIAKSSLQNILPLMEGLSDTNMDPELQLHEQEKRIEISCALATEASRRSRLISVPVLDASSPSTPPSSPLPSTPPPVTVGSHLMCV